MKPIDIPDHPDLPEQFEDEDDDIELNNP